MSLDWTVRRCRPGDAPALALIGAASFLDTFAGIFDGCDIVAHCERYHLVQHYESLLAQPCPMWLAEAPGGAPVGYAVLAEPDLPLADIGPGDIEVKRIYALARYHGSGLGGALMAAAVDEAIDAGRRRLLLGVDANNDRAIAFYRKQGFEPVGGRRFQVGAAFVDDVILARVLKHAESPPT